jgi:hypothetical protein
MEITVGALVVTAFTLVGALALWAVTSPRHWSCWGCLRIVGGFRIDGFRCPPYCS